MPGAAPGQPLAPAIEMGPGTQDNGLSLMIAQLIRQNVLDRPHKHAELARLHGSVALVANDAETALTLRFTGGKVWVYAGVHGTPDLVVEGSSEDLLNLSRLPLGGRWRLPDVRSGVTRELFAAMRAGRLHTRGSARHAGLALGLTRLLSIH